MTGHALARWSLPASLVAVLALGSVGCESNYKSLTFRPVDTTSQLTVSDVQLKVGPPGTAGAERAKTDEHGQAKLTNLKAGDVVTLVKPGYEVTVVELQFGGYRQRSPGSSKTTVNFPLTDGETVPVPMHRTGQVRNARTSPVQNP